MGYVTLVSILNISVEFRWAIKDRRMSSEVCTQMVLKAWDSVGWWRE